MSLKVGHTYIAEVTGTRIFRKIGDIQKWDLITFSVESETEKTVDLSIGDYLIRITRARFDSSADLVEDLGSISGGEKLPGVKPKPWYEEYLKSHIIPELESYNYLPDLETWLQIDTRDIKDNIPTRYFKLEASFKGKEPTVIMSSERALPKFIKGLMEADAHLVERIIITKI